MAAATRFLCLASAFSLGCVLLGGCAPKDYHDIEHSARAPVAPATPAAMGHA